MIPGLKIGRGEGYGYFVDTEQNRNRWFPALKLDGVFPSVF
jgi:hypothetical protein